MSPTKEIQELVQFLKPNSRQDLKNTSLELILGLTSHSDGLHLIVATSELLSSLTNLLKEETEPISKATAKCLINISADETGASTLIKLQIIPLLASLIVDPTCEIADECSMILSNLTRPKQHIHEIADDINMEKIIKIFTKLDYNKKGSSLHHLAQVLSNLSQSAQIRDRLMDESKCHLLDLISFIGFPKSLVRRAGIISMLRNCSFDVDRHSWLLGESVDLLPKLLLPLADGTEFDEEDNDKLPVELQYLLNDKKREVDPAIRCMLLEILLQLCIKRQNREYIRDKNTYVILRELHKSEPDKKVLLACENVVDLLIRTEEEIGVDDYREIDVSSEMADKFRKADEEFLS